MKRTHLTALSCLIALSFSAHGQTLEQAVAMTLASNPEIKSSFNEYMSYIKQNQVSEGAYRPSVDLDAGIGHEDVDMASGVKNKLMRKEATLSLTQLIWDGSSTLNDIDRTAAEAESMRLQLLSDAEDKALEVAEVYLDAVKANEILQLSERNLRVHKKIYKDIKKKAESGIGSTADLRQVESRMARANSNLLAAQNNIYDLNTQFTRLVGQSPQRLIFPRPDEDALPLSLEAATETAKQNHPVIQIAIADVDAARYQYKQTKGKNLPTFSVEASHTLRYDAGGYEGESTETLAMLRMNYNLFNGGADTAEQERMAYQLNKTKDLRDRAYRSVEESLRLSWSALDLTLQQKEFLADQVDSAAETVIAYEKQFQIGKRTLLDLLNSEDELFEARKDYLDAHYEEQYAKYRVLNSAGILLDSLLVDIPKEWNQKVEY